MAITFQKIRWKNFLSTGDAFTEIDLNTRASTLIVGPNGSGKSTLLDALSFALFGKPHRDINKPQLVNSINGKNCEVSVEFRVGKTDFKIVRGIKPGIFEIWQNGVLVNQEAHALDYQKVLEQNILKLNHKSFHQIVVLGSSSFIPFMQLPNTHRREVIEDLLDINIFTKMNVILKERVVKLREQLADVTANSTLHANTIEMQKKYIADLKKRNEDSARKSKEKISQYLAEVELLVRENEKDNAVIQAGHEIAQKRAGKLHDKRQSFVMYQNQIKSNIDKIVKEAKFYETNEQCPTCVQPLNQVFRSVKIDACKTKAKELSEGQEKLTAELRSLTVDLDEVNAELAKFTALINGINERNSGIRRLQRLVSELESDAAVAVDSDLSEAEAKLMDMLAAQQANSKIKSQCYEEGSYNNAISEMLKDSGIKTKIIKQYLPVMNKLINQYLQTLDFFVSFHLDEAFEEVIRSRHRDEFTYASFSEGEKQRIDLALLFTWRQIARMKNSVSTNLLILDETFDSSMDAEGVENLLKILRTLDEGTSVFIISHKTDALDGKFPNKLEFAKEKNFSVIRQKNI